MGSDSFAPLAQFVSRGINPLEFFQAAVDRQQCNVDRPVRRRKQQDSRSRPLAQVRGQYCSHRIGLPGARRSPKEAELSIQQPQCLSLPMPQFGEAWYRTHIGEWGVIQSSDFFKPTKTCLGKERRFPNVPQRLQISRRVKHDLAALTGWRATQISDVDLAVFGGDGEDVSCSLGRPRPPRRSTLKALVQSVRRICRIDEYLKKRRAIRLHLGNSEL